MYPLSPAKSLVPWHILLVVFHFFFFFFTSKLIDIELLEVDFSRSYLASEFKNLLMSLFLIISSKTRHQSILKHNGRYDFREKRMAFFYNKKKRKKKRRALIEITDFVTYLIRGVSTKTQ